MNTRYIKVAFLMMYLALPNTSNCAVHHTNEAEEVRAFSDFAIGDEGKSFIINVLNNDQGISEGVSSLVITVPPKFGVAEVINNAFIKYTPIPGNTGDDELMYRVCNNEGSCGEAKVYMSILDYDFMPVACNDTIILEPGISSEINVLKNDSNLFDLPITLRIVANLKDGFSQLTDDGLLSATFDVSFRGVDSLQYQITDKEGDSDQAWVFYFANGPKPSEMFIPQGISPNEDGFNDFFTIPDLKEIPMEIKIFDVNGHVVFLDKNYNNKWDGNANVGRFAGKPCNNGTYYFVLRTTDFNKEYSGFIYVKQ